MAVLGIDACKKGWIGIVLDAGSPLTAVYGRTLPELQSQVQVEIEVITIDMPIGLPASGAREADLLASKLLGKLGPAVFPIPPAEVLEAPTFEEANEIARRLIGKGVSIFAYSLQRKIFEVAEWAKGQPVFEVHPEVSFRAMAGSPLSAAKKTWAGFHERQHLLRQSGLNIDVDLGPAGKLAAVDDVLDAAVAAWSARRIADGVAIRLPEADAQDGKSAPAIWA